MSFRGVGHVIEHAQITVNLHAGEDIYEMEVRQLKEECPVILQLSLPRTMRHHHTKKYIMDKFNGLRI